MAVSKSFCLFAAGGKEGRTIKKNTVYYVLALPVLAVSAALVFTMTALAGGQQPTLNYGGYQLRSIGSIVYSDAGTEQTAEFHCEDLYRLAEEINALRAMIK